VEKVRNSTPREEFTREVQLQLLDAIREGGKAHDQGGAASARQEAERLYQQAVEELRALVAQMLQ
jgi:hypothetical protein